MKKFLSLLLSVTLIFSFALFAIASSDSDERETVTQGDNNADNPPENNEIGDYSVEIIDARIETPDYYDAKKQVVIKYSYTNNSKDSVSFSTAFDYKAYQDGVELERGYMPGEYYQDGNFIDNFSKEIKPGVSINVEVAYELNNETSDVEAEITDFWDVDKVITKTFPIA